MTIIKVPAEKKVLDLGGGGKRLSIADWCVDFRLVPGVDQAMDFNGPLPLASDEWDVAWAHFVLEHVSWRNVRQLLAEILRILKPGGIVFAAVPDTEAQMKSLLAREDWGDDASCLLFGTLDYPENLHRCAFSPRHAARLFQEAGFVAIHVGAYCAKLPPIVRGGETDLFVMAAKPPEPVPMPALGWIDGELIIEVLGG